MEGLIVCRGVANHTMLRYRSVYQHLTIYSVRRMCSMCSECVHRVKRHTVNHSSDCIYACTCI